MEPTQAVQAAEPIARQPRSKRRRTNRNMFQDTKGRWWLDYYTPEGQRRRKLCGSHENAKAALAEIDLAKKRDTYTDPNAAPSFKDYSQKYLETVSVHKESHEREQRLMQNLLEHFGEARLSKIKRSRVIEYRKVRLKTVKPATVNREVALLRHLFNVAIDEGLIAVNPARGGPGLKAFKEQRRMRYLEMDEVETLLMAIQVRIVKNSTDKLKASAKKYWQYLHTAVTAALHTGMRKGEILGMRWDQINWEKRHILLTDTKNSEPRRVPIDTMLLHELSEHRQRIVESDLVFPSYDRNGKVVSMGDVKVSFGQVLRDAAITNFRFHDLRHTFASHYMMSGGNLYTLAKILGHKDIKMTQRYADLSPDFIDRERDRLDTIWTPAANPASSNLPTPPRKYVQ
ncbi:MAG: tyrosine-type recombinase/integrase [Candidatus Acidiferrales bacterium]